MIKKLVFKSLDNPFNEKEIDISFSENTNIIVGPKGGGKTTMFNLLAGIENNYITNRTKSALESLGLDFVRAELYNGEKIFANNIELRKLKKTDEDHTDDRYDIISQNDKIKTRLDSDAVIENDLHKWTERKVESNSDVRDFVQKLRNFHNKVQGLSQFLSNNEINWSNTFDMKSRTKNTLSIIEKLAYNNTFLLSEIHNANEILNQNIISYENHINKFNSITKNITTDISKHYDQDFIKQITALHEVTIANLTELIKQSKHQISKLEIKYKIIQIFWLVIYKYC